MTALPAIMNNSAVWLETESSPGAAKIPFGTGCVSFERNTVEVKTTAKTEKRPSTETRSIMDVTHLLNMVCIAATRADVAVIVADSLATKAVTLRICGGAEAHRRLAGTLVMTVRAERINAAGAQAPFATVAVPTAAIVDAANWESS